MADPPGSWRDDEEPRVLANGAPTMRYARFQLVLYTVLLLGWGWLAIDSGSTLYVVPAALAAVPVPAYAEIAVSSPRTELVITDKAVTLRRRSRPMTIDRQDVVCVGGDVEGRPSWSHRVLIRTGDGRSIRLPELDRSPGLLVPVLQERAGVGERPVAGWPTDRWTGRATALRRYSSSPRRRRRSESRMDPDTPGRRRGRNL